MGILDRVDKALYFYYKHMNKSYDPEYGKFKEYIEDNGYDEDAIQEELDENAIVEDTDFVSVDDDFPLYSYIDDTNEEQKNKEIFRILQHCYLHGFCHHIRLGDNPLESFKTTKYFPMS